MSTSASKGAAYSLENVAGQDVLPLAGSVANTGQSVYDQYLQWLQDITSADPKTRMAAAAPQISAINAQAKGAKKQISQLPRGGERDYLMAQVDQNSASEIGNAINDWYTKGKMQQGLAGQWGISTGLQGDVAAGNLFANAGNTLAGIAAQQAAGTSSTISTIGQIAAMVAAFL